MRIISGKKSVLETFPQILHDESQYSSGVPQSVYFPQSTNDLQPILNYANQNSIPIVFVGAQTGTTGGAVPIEGSIAVCFSAMNKINTIKWDGIYPVLYCDPGVTLSSISAFLDSPEKWPYHVPGTELLQNCRFMYPPDPTESTAQLGGTVATNASGARSFRFGPTRAFVEHLSCVLATGETLEIPRGSHFSSNNGFNVITDQGRSFVIPTPSYDSPVVKNVSGYFSQPKMDLIDLIIGSEGTLTAISGIGIRLYPSVQILSGMSFFDNNESAFNFADFLRQDTQVVSIEYFDESALSLVINHKDRLSEHFPQFPAGKNTAIFWEFMENHPEPFESRFDLYEKQLILSGSSFDHTWSGLELSERERLRKFRHTIPELINAVIAKHKIDYPSLRKIGTDTAVPSQVFREVYCEYLTRIKKRSIEYASFGHLGDHHLHINLIPSTASEMASALEIYREIMDITIKSRGTVSAEHGIGKIKKEYFHRMYSSDAIEQMRAIKAAFDPKEILNSGNLF